MGTLETIIKGKVFVAIDFDGTITKSRDDNFGKYEMRENCKDVLLRLYATGRVHFGLWTCRTGKQVDTAISFLAENNVFHVFETINQSFDDILAVYDTTPRKVSADVYLDDRALLGREVDWLEFEQYIMGILATQDMERDFDGYDEALG